MSSIARQLEFLLMPVGEPGTGAARYAAAMHLYQKRLLTEDVLEVFRICAPDDKIDPFAQLERRGIANPIPELLERNRT